MAGRARDIKIGGLAVLVAAWWLSIAAIVVATLPDSAVSAPKVPVVIEPGRFARIEQPGMPTWPIPVDRAAFDELRRAYRESDEHAIERTTQATAWITVSHRQAVQVAAVDGDAVQVLLLEGEHAGHQGWLLARHLSAIGRD